jgi:hypothetical protein
MQIRVNLRLEFGFRMTGALKICYLSLFPGELSFLISRSLIARANLIIVSVGGAFAAGRKQRLL